VYLWLTAQARSWWAWASLVTGTVSFAALWMAFPLTMYKIVRNIHLLLASFSLPFLIMYGVSAVQMSHSAWFQMKPAVHEQELSITVRDDGCTSDRACSHGPGSYGQG
jgi:hypothetical protein